MELNRWNELMDRVRPEETDLILKIVDRLFANGTVLGRQKIDWVMDITLYHAIRPLRLKDLLDAKLHEFMHDTLGIARQFNRDTLEIEDDFQAIFEEGRE